MNTKELIDDLRGMRWIDRVMCSSAADKIESLTAANERLRSALEEAILWGEFQDLCNKWRKVLEETKR